MHYRKQPDKTSWLFFEPIQPRGRRRLALVRFDARLGDMPIIEFYDATPEERLEIEHRARMIKRPQMVEVKPASPTSPMPEANETVEKTLFEGEEAQPTSGETTTEESSEEPNEPHGDMPPSSVDSDAKATLEMPKREPQGNEVEGEGDTKTEVETEVVSGATSTDEEPTSPFPEEKKATEVTVELPGREPGSTLPSEKLELVMSEVGSIQEKTRLVEGPKSSVPDSPMVETIVPEITQPKKAFPAVVAPLETHRITILCEGQTEVQYFREIVRYLGIDRFVDIAVTEEKDPYGILMALGTLLKPSDEVWMVFDRDHHNGFYRALAFAKGLPQVHCVPTNPCFEYWFLLHFKAFKDDLPFDEQQERETHLEKRYSGQCNVMHITTTTYEYFTKPETCLTKLKHFFPGYQKNRPDCFHRLASMMQVAYKRAKAKPMDELVHTSSIPELFDRLCELSGHTPDEVFEKMRQDFPLQSVHWLPNMAKWTQVLRPDVCERLARPGGLETLLKRVKDILAWRFRPSATKVQVSAEDLKVLDMFFYWLLGHVDLSKQLSGVSNWERKRQTTQSFAMSLNSYIDTILKSTDLSIETGIYARMLLAMVHLLPVVKDDVAEGFEPVKG